MPYPVGTIVYYAMAGDDEFVFTVPSAKMEDLMSELRHLESTGSKLPRNHVTRKEPEQPESYVKIARMLGMMGDK